jgi:hypothetical protein
MSRFLAAVLCSAALLATNTSSQAAGSDVEPIRVSAGTILTFHLQTRLRHSDTDPLDELPQGTVLHVKILGPIDSSVDRDGSEFRGSVVADLALGEGVVVHSDSEVRGLLVLLRSRNHPDGFRYELLLTQLTDHGKSYPLTASLNSSFYDSSAQPSSPTKVDGKESAKPSVTGNTKFPVDPAQ